MSSDSSRIGSVLAGGFSLLVCVAAAWASLPQESLLSVEKIHQPGIPIPYSVTCSPTAAAEGATECKAILKNATDRPIKAFSLEYLPGSSEGRILSRNTRSASRGYPLPFPRQAFDPGEQIVMERLEVEVGAQRVRFRVVFAEFVDGSVWGDADSPDLLHMRAERLGAHTAIEFLRFAKRLNSAQGTLQALRDSLRDGSLWNRAQVPDPRWAQPMEVGAKQIIKYLNQVEKAKGPEIALAQYGIS